MRYLLKGFPPDTRRKMHLHLASFTEKARQLDGGPYGVRLRFFTRDMGLKYDEVGGHDRAQWVMEALNKDGRAFLLDEISYRAARFYGLRIEIDEGDGCQYQ